MVNQGDIIWLDFDPQSGHEQGGRRPALVVSNEEFNRISDEAMVCPITRRDKGYPFQVRLDARTVTGGVIKCDQLKTLDLHSRNYTFVERLPDDILSEVLDLVRGFLEKDGAPLVVTPPCAVGSPPL
jgi:mRNA interferase MazF